MSKFKIEHGASKVNLVLLKTNIEDTIAEDIDALAAWSNNDRKYIVNELLRFALLQEEDFQKHKSRVSIGLAPSPASGRSGSTPHKPVSENAPKADSARE